MESHWAGGFEHFIQRIARTPNQYPVDNQLVHNTFKYTLTAGLISTLIACGSQKDNFVANCSGKVIQYEEPSLQVSQIESRKYQFTANALPGEDCKFADHVIFCYREKVVNNQRTKNQVAFDRGNYTLTHIETTIKIGKNGEPDFVKTRIYQASCPVSYL